MNEAGRIGNARALMNSEKRGRETTTESRSTSSREPHKDDEAILRLTEGAGNGNPTSNTSCTQFSKLLF
jgi:hypothetical protein